VKILGIDPGTRCIGYGVIHETGPGRFAPLEYGSVSVARNKEFPQKLEMIYNSINDILKKTQPDEVAVEDVFVSKNANTALKLGHARGVILLAAVRSGLPVAEYAPREVKKSIVGFGNASKQQIQMMVARLLGMGAITLQEDAADSLAVALCHGMRNTAGTMIRG